MDIVLLIILGAVIIYQGITNYSERQKATKRENDLLNRLTERENDLLNRLMARDFTDYTIGSKNMELDPIVKSEQLMKLEEERTTLELEEMKAQQNILPVN